MSISSSGPRSCTVRLDQVSTQDRGSYMCLLNQADVFHTDRRWGQSAVGLKTKVREYCTEKAPGRPYYYIVVLGPSLG